MNRTSLPDDAGMLFVFQSTSRWAFGMKNTLIPLSVGFIDDQWKMVDIQDMRGKTPVLGNGRMTDRGGVSCRKTP